MKFYHLLVVLVFISVSRGMAQRDYFVHPRLGNDSNSGESFKEPFRSLDKISQLKLVPGDRVFLAGGEQFKGTLNLIEIDGDKHNPIHIDVYGEGKALIDARGELNGIQLINSSHITIRNLQITANGPDERNIQGEMRVGILISGKGTGRTSEIELDGIDIFDIFYENEGARRSDAEVRSANGTQKYGWGIRLIAEANATIENVRIQNSTIKNVSHTGIKLTGTRLQNITGIKLYDNELLRTGGPGIQMSGVKYVHVKGNQVNYSGSKDDSRKWGRGSGLWTWSASNVLIEHNSFMNANGPGDSAGAHIDFNCDNIVLQYNFSANNAGGFCEILGNNYNCAYRFNISVNDGHRVKGEKGAFQEGKIFWLSGYQGEQKPRKGPVNSYFYNNTIYVKAGQDSKIAIDNRSKGILIANNIFHLEGSVMTVLGDQYKPDDGTDTGSLEHVFFENNLFLNASNWPADSMIQDAKPLFGNAGFKNPGGMNPEDYVPSNGSLVKKGIEIPFIPNDEFGLLKGLNLPVDFFGNSIGPTPIMGAVNIH